jgi:4'-phosphopantetheinyl transferase
VTSLNQVLAGSTVVRSWSRGPKQWSPGPEHPRLTDGAVHVWKVDLAFVPDDVTEYLSTEEGTRAACFLRKHDGLLWARSRGVLRELLGRYLHKDPRALRFAAGAHGKPRLLADAAEPSAGERLPPASEHSLLAGSSRLSFNLSHSGALALYAISRACEMGVDVELARRSIDEVALARRALGPSEARRLQRLPPAERRREFLRAWVRHEAWLKGRGVGIGGTPAAVGDGALKPWIAELDVGPGAAAVAAETPPREAHCWEWELRHAMTRAGPECPRRATWPRQSVAESELHAATIWLDAPRRRFTQET